MNLQILCYALIVLISSSCAHKSTRVPADLSSEIQNVTLPIEKLKTHPDFSVKLYAIVPGARSLARHFDGTIFVSTGGFSNPYDRIYRLRDQNNDHQISANELEILISDLENPNGLALRGDDLYVGETSRIRVYRKISQIPWGSTLRPEQGEVLKLELPSEGYHGWKYLKFKPNTAWLYFAVGAPCNVCVEKDMFNQIFRFNVDTNKLEVVARGQRNSVGFDFHPISEEFYFTDNGRDLAGENFPPDELNRVVKNGEHYGFPYCHGQIRSDGKHKDGEFNSKNEFACEKAIPPVLELNPHGAALGMRFMTSSQVPNQYKHQVVIAEHGSWNRNQKIGYQVGISQNLNTKPEYKPFVWGWLDTVKNEAWGRPVDIEMLPDASFLISDDGIRGSLNPGAIYRVHYTKRHPYTIRQ